MSNRQAANLDYRNLVDGLSYLIPQPCKTTNLAFIIIRVKDPNKSNIYSEVNSRD